MKAKVLLLTLCITTTCWGSVAQADQLILKSGDVLAGTLKGVDQGQLVWDSPVLGELKVDLQHVQVVDSAQPVEMQTDFGDLQQCVLMAQEGNQLLNCASGELALDSWSSVKRLADKIVPPEVAQRLTNEGEVKLALQESSGNTDTESYDVDARVVVAYDQFRHTLYTAFENEKTDGDDIKDNFELGYNFDYFLSEKWFVASNISYLEDDFKNIDSEFSLGSGIGYQFFETDELKLSTTAGLNYLEREFGDGSSEESEAIRLAVDYRWTPAHSDYEVYHTSEVLQTLSGDGYTLDSLTGISVPINGHLDSVFEYDYDYDSEPTPGTNSVDRKWSFGVRYKW